MGKKNFGVWCPDHGLGLLFKKRAHQPLKRLKAGIVVALFPMLGQTQTLQNLITFAVASHPAIQAQQAQQGAARAGVDSARWQFYPTPSIAVEQASTSVSDSTHQGDRTVSTLSLQQPLWTGGRLTAGLQKAEASLNASRASLEEVRQQLALRVVQTYGDWLAAHLKLQAYDKSRVTHVRLSELVKRRIQEGISSDSDLILAVARLQSLASDIAMAQAQQDVALARLAQLLGRPVEAVALQAMLAAPQPLRAGLSSLLDQALAQNPAIQKAQAQAQIQESVIAERRADLAPEVYLRVERQYGNYAVRNSPSESRLFIGLNSRFGAGLASKSNVEGARAQHQAALAEVALQGRSVSEQILTDHALATSSQTRLLALQASRQAAQDVSESYDRQFLAGRKTWLDVMNAARELAQTEAQVADIEATQVIATWRLAIYSQGLTQVLETAS
jgi:adhesin transport system outer membrane protein